MVLLPLLLCVQQGYSLDDTMPDFAELERREAEIVRGMEAITARRAPRGRASEQRVAIVMAGSARSFIFPAIHWSIKENCKRTVVLPRRDHRLADTAVPLAHPSQ
jgi:hypothetical protein